MVVVMQPPPPVSAPEGRMDAKNVCRIGVGGFLMTSYLQRLLQLRWPSAMAAITLSRSEVGKLLLGSVHANLDRVLSIDS